MKILLVDDEPGLRVTLAANLELEGFEVTEAHDGAAALELLAKESFDVVLTDVRMPGMSGVELFQAIKKKYPGLPVVLSTAFALEEAIRDALREGVFTVLPKPPDVANVIATLTRAARRPFVLVVDDAKSGGAATLGALSAIGLRVRGATTGAEALAILRSGDVDVCVVDLATPGPAFIEQMRVALPNVVVVAISANDVSDLIQRAAAAGAFACLRKPFSPAELVQAVAEARGGRRRY